MTLAPVRQPKVMLASMPWAALGEPSLGLGVLAACLGKAGVPVRVRHFNLTLLRYLRANTYVGLANSYAINDFLFTYDIDSDVSGVQYRLALDRLEELCELQILGDKDETAESLLERLLEARQSLFPKWLDECASEIAAYQPTMVGFTCLFDQTMASVSLARRVRALLPDALIVFGGYALEGPVAHELIRCFDWIDAICLGEGEATITSLAQASVGTISLESIPNVLTSKSKKQPSLVLYNQQGHKLATREPIKRAAPISMDESPIPDFDDYFSDLEELATKDRVVVEVDTLPVESSRGCWWGQKHHCTFCGIDDETMKYRMRSTDETIRMLDTLAQRYSINSFRFSDYILPFNYFKTVLPLLAKREVKYHLECETKANLKAAHFELLSKAGVGEFQPGIESFSTSVLDKMSKGVTCIQNIKTLVLGRIYGIRVHYNFLYGFPDDEVMEYQRLLELIPRLYHLDPPHGCQPIEITRFAPLQVDPIRFGIKETEHSELYEVIFSPQFLRKTGFDLDAYAYYFERSFTHSLRLEEIYQMLQLQINHWKRISASREVKLQWSADKQGICFNDTRYDEAGTLYKFGTDHLAVFEACCNEFQTVEQISKKVDIVKEDIERIIEELDQVRVIACEDQRIIGLATQPINTDTKQSFTRKWVAA